MTVEGSCQPLSNNRSSDCWTIVPVTAEESCQPLLSNRASDCWRIVPVTVEQPCQTFLKLVKEHFPRNNTFHEIFNKNTSKTGYSCMRNISSITASHNKSILRQKAKEYGYNCRNKESCSLQNQCLTPKLIYETTVINASDEESAKTLQI